MDCLNIFLETSANLRKVISFSKLLTSKISENRSFSEIFRENRSESTHLSINDFDDPLIVWETQYVSDSFP